MNIRKNILLALSSGLLLGLPWSIPSLFFLIFIAWVPLLLLEEENRHHPNPYTIFNYAFVSFLLWNILGTWWIAQAQLLGAILIIFANALVQALVFWMISRTRTRLNIPLVFPFLLIWMGYEYFHQSWDLAWPWLNLGNALATAPKLIQWYEFTGIRGGTLWIILTNLAILKGWDIYRKRGMAASAPVGAGILLLILVPALASYLIFQNFEEEGETVTVALIQPNLDPYTEKFIPEKQAQHLKDFFKVADTICDDETNFLLGPETLIVQQIDERDPEASPYFRELLDFQKKYPKLTILLGVHSFQKLSDEDIPPGSRFNKEDPSSITKPSWSPCSSACPLCSIWDFWENSPWSSADTPAPTLFVRKDPIFYCLTLPSASCRLSVLSPSSVSIAPKTCPGKKALSP